MSWMNIARIFKVLALVLFLTPWLVVSCQGSPLIEASGMDLITGDLEPSRDSPLGSMVAQAEADSASTGEVPGEEQGQPGAGALEDGRWWVMLGGGLIALALVLGVVLRPLKTAALGAVAAGALALATLGGGMAWTVHEFKSELREAADQVPSGDDQFSQFGRSMAAGVAGGISIDIRWGFWMTSLALLLGVAAAGQTALGVGFPKITVSPRES